MLQFRGCVVTSDAGLLAYRELDDALGLTALAGEMLADARTGKNGRHELIGMLRQSVFGRLAGYEGVNDAERLRHDPAMRWIVGGKAAQGCAASPSQMGRFETQWLAAEKQPFGADDLSGRWINLVHSRRPPRGIVLDMDSSVSPTHGEQEMSFWNGHYECICYHPLFVFNQFGDLERCVLRPGNVHSATTGRVCSNRSLCGIGARSRGSISPGRCSLRHAGGLRVPGGRADQIRDPAARQSGPSEQDRLSAQAPSRTAAERSPAVHANFTYQAASWTKPRRVIARSSGLRRLHPRVGFIVTNLSREIGGDDD